MRVVPREVRVTRRSDATPEGGEPLGGGGDADAGAGTTYPLQPEDCIELVNIGLRESLLSDHNFRFQRSLVQDSPLPQVFFF